MIRITTIAETPKEVVLKVEGHISEEDVVVLEAEGERNLQYTERLVLDLSGIKFIDEAGIQLLQRWSGERLVLQGASRFIQTLLKAHGLCSKSDE